MKTIKLLKKSFIILFLFSFQFSVTGADLVFVSTVSDDILHLNFEEGHIDYYGEGQKWWTGADNKVYYSPLNTTDATTAGNYSITSPDDATWGTVTPTQVGRKSKGLDYNAPNGTPEYMWDHQIYLKLPKKLTSGKTYTITVGNLADNMNEFTFVFDEKVLRSETVKVNQIGFPENGKKVAYLTHFLGDMSHLELNTYDGQPFNIVRYSDKQVVHTGTINFRYEHDRTILLTHNSNPVSITGPYGNNTMADEAEMDFSAFTDPGEYVVSVPGIGCSWPFEISNEVISEPFYTAMKGLFYQRACIVRQLPEGGEYPRDHHPDDVTHYYNPNMITFHTDGGTGRHNAVNDAFKNGTYPLDKPVTGIWGWYHDASDWDMYITHYRIPLQLLLLYELAPDKFYDGEIGNKYKLHKDDANWIDEGTNGLPDLLDEASWLAKYGKRARQALIDQGYGSGGVPGYIGREGGVPGALYPSWTDTREWAVTGENPSYTMSYAAVAAYYANNLNRFHQLTNPGQNHPDHQTWLDEAIEAYDWSLANGGVYPGEGFTGYQTVAAINLYIATGQTKYRDDVNATYGVDDNTNYHTEAASIPIGFISAALIEMHPELDFSATVKSDAEKELRKQADMVVGRTDNMGCRYGGFDEDGYSLGMFSTPKIVMPSVRYFTNGDQSYIDAALHNMANVCGGNQLNYVHLSQLGERPQNEAIHHIDSWCMNDMNSMVYSWECVPGVATYFGAPNNWVSGVGSHIWTKEACYPIHDESPRSEMNFPNRESINGSEYTTQQNIISWAFAAGVPKAVYGSKTSGDSHNPRPTVTLNFAEGQSIGYSCNVELTSTASTDTRSVKYYYNWHYIGESFDKSNNFSLLWNPAETNLTSGETVLITAVAYDDKGLKSWPTDDIDRNVTLDGSCGPYIQPSPSSLSFTSDGGSKTVNVNSNISSWSITDDATWITVNPISGGDNTTITVTVDAYTNTTTDRTGTITISGGGETATIDVFQEHVLAEFTITATVNGNGTITPSGVVTVLEGKDQSFSFSADQGYQLSDVLVDGSSVGIVPSYDFTNVTDNHTIEAVFIAFSGWLEDFEDLNDGLKSDAGSTAWTATGGGQTLNKEFQGGGVNGTVIWESETISIGGTADVSIDVAGIPGVGSDGMEASDYIKTFYQLDGGSWVEFSNNTADFAWKTETANGLSGSTIKIRVETKTSFGDEFYYIDNVTVATAGGGTTYTLSVSAVNGSVAKSPNKTSYNDGETVSLSATPNPGYIFDSWGGDITGTTNPVSITMDENKSVTANFIAIPTYTLTINATNGSVAKSPNKTDYNDGESVSLTATPDAGYQFDNWSGDATGTSNPVSITMDADKTVTANFSPIPTYTLTINSANGTVTKSPDKASYLEGESVDLTVTPDACYSFANWSDDASGTATTVTITMNGDKTVTANYTMNSYTLSYTAGSNGTLTGTTSQTVNCGSNGTSVEAVPNSGYQFINWNDGRTDNPRTDVNVMANVNVTAQFNLTGTTTYTLTYTAGSNGSIIGVSPQTIIEGEDGSSVMAVANSGYRFVQWNDGSTQNPRTDLAVNADISVIATFEAIPVYTLTYSAGANGSINGTATQSVEEGQNGTSVEAIPNAGYVFSNWSDGVTSNPRTDLNVNADITVSAIFSPITYTLTYIAAPNGGLTGNVLQTIDHGNDGSSVSAVPNAGYEFSGWSDGSTDNPRVDLNVTADITVTANFSAISYTLTINEVNCIVSRNPDKAMYNHGESVTLQAIPNTGYVFDNWSGDMSSTNASITITMDGDKTWLPRPRPNQQTVLTSTWALRWAAPSLFHQTAPGLKMEKQ